MMLISALMPTWNRRRFIRQAVSCFQSQTWPEKELIILDDGQEPVHDLVAGAPNVFCFKEERRPIPAKLNRLGEIATGDIFIRWDDDDWSDPGRMEQQARRLQDSGKGATGYRSILFWDGSRAWRYCGARDFVLGTSICSTRGYWLANPWDEAKTVASDNPWVARASVQGELDCIDGDRMMVARVHPGNTSVKRMASPNFQPVSADEVPAGFMRSGAAAFRLKAVSAAYRQRVTAPLLRRKTRQMLP